MGGVSLDSHISWWVGFHLFVFAMLVIDLGVFHKKEHEVSVKESLIWTMVWISLALVFNLGVYQVAGEAAASEFLTAYVLEKSLSVDNIFVMSLIFTYFKVEKRFQHRVLFWGILGALVMRILFIVGGVALINRFHFILYFFGAFLIYTGLKMLFSGGDDQIKPEEGMIYKFAKKYFKMTDKFHEEKFFVIENGVRHMTPLFLVLLMIESTDLIFAVDSIPATLSVTKSAFIAYTSNIFAILGLRSLYFAFAGVVGLFRFLSYALSVVLIFIGVKMLTESFYKIPSSYSLGFVLGIISFSVICSLLIPEPKENKGE
jgi:tellurite resistance protein TerC